MHGLATATIAAPRPSPPWETGLLRPIPSDYADMDSGMNPAFNAVSVRAIQDARRVNGRPSSTFTSKCGAGPGKGSAVGGKLVKPIVASLRRPGNR